MKISKHHTTHPNGTKFIYIKPGLTIHANVKLNKDGKTYNCRNAYLIDIPKDQPTGVYIEYPDGVKRFISNSWYE